MKSATAPNRFLKLLFGPSKTINWTPKTVRSNPKRFYRNPIWPPKRFHRTLVKGVIRTTDKVPSNLWHRAPPFISAYPSKIFPSFCWLGKGKLRKQHFRASFQDPVFLLHHHVSLLQSWDAIIVFTTKGISYVFKCEVAASIFLACFWCDDSTITRTITLILSPFSQDASPKMRLSSSILPLCLCIICLFFLLSSMSTREHVAWACEEETEKAPFVL